MTPPPYWLRPIIFTMAGRVQPCRNRVGPRFRKSSRIDAHDVRRLVDSFSSDDFARADRAYAAIASVRRGLYVSARFGHREYPIWATSSAK